MKLNHRQYLLTCHICLANANGCRHEASTDTNRQTKTKLLKLNKVYFLLLLTFKVKQCQPFVVVVFILNPDPALLTTTTTTTTTIISFQFSSQITNLQSCSPELSYFSIDGSCKIQAQKGSNQRLFISTWTHSTQLFKIIPFVKPQNDT